MQTVLSTSGELFDLHRSLLILTGILRLVRINAHFEHIVPVRSVPVVSAQAHALPGINDISLSPDSLYLSTASDDSTILIFPLSSSSSSSRHPTPLRRLEAHTSPVLSIAFSPKSNLLVSGSIDESAIIWDVKGGRVLRTLPAHSEPVWTVGWDNEGGMVITGSADGLM